MNGISSAFVGFQEDWKSRIKQEAWGKVFASPLMKGCATGDIKYIVALLAGFWDFVDRFPAIIRGTFMNIPAGSPKLQKFLRRAAGKLSGTLTGMEEDERNHRTLWLKAAGMVDLNLEKLMGWKVLPEIDLISSSIERAEIRKKLLYFVAVEIVAEGISKYLSQYAAFEKVMGQKGMGWFKAHLVHPTDGTTHEDIAYRAAYQMYQAAGEIPSEEKINFVVQECVDLFSAADRACIHSFTRAPLSMVHAV